MPERDVLSRSVGARAGGGALSYCNHLVINDHGCDCPRYAVVNAATETVRKRRNHEQGVVNF